MHYSYEGKGMYLEKHLSGNFRIFRILEIRDISMILLMFLELGSFKHLKKDVTFPREKQL